MKRRLLLAVPLLVAGGAGVGFWSMLRGMQTGTFDPRSVGHPLVGKPVPAFNLAGFTDADLREAGGPVLLNFFASWCVPCVQEADALAGLQKTGAKLFGIAYKDKAPDTAAFLAKHGDPYRLVAADSSGQVAIDFGVTGVPETFLVDPSGIVRWHYSGPLTEAVIDSQLAARLHG